MPCICTRGTIQALKIFIKLTDGEAHVSLPHHLSSLLLLLCPLHHLPRPQHLPTICRHSTCHPPHEQLLVRLGAGGVLSVVVGGAVVDCPRCPWHCLCHSWHPDGRGGSCLHRRCGHRCLLEVVIAGRQVFLSQRVWVRWFGSCVVVSELKAVITLVE
jgi:hypothetical protein